MHRSCASNTEDYPHETSLRWTRTATCGSSCREKNSISHRSRPSGFVAPVPRRVPDEVDEQLAGWAARESQEALDGVWRTLEARWINHPDANWLAGCKPEQLTRAVRAGFEIPPTLVTNDARELRAFAARYDSRLACKPLYEGLVPSPEDDRVFWTSRFDVDDADTLSDRPRRRAVSVPGPRAEALRRSRDRNRQRSLRGRHRQPVVRREHG